MMHSIHRPAAASRQSAVIQILRNTIAALCLTLPCAAVIAQDAAVVIPPGGYDKPGQTPPIKVHISGFSGEVNTVLNFDLHVMGFLNVPLSEAQYLITGSASGNLQGVATDAINKQVRLNKAYSGGSLRKQAHAFADDIALTLSGDKGIAQTRIAFKNERGGSSEIQIADFDGFGAQAVTKDGALVSAPAWVPGKLALCYTSYRLNNPDVFHHDLSSGARTAIARYSGSNLSPAVSPDGRKVALIMSKDGSPDLYVCNIDGSGLIRLTRSKEDESSPCWSPDGKWICFAAKQGSRGLFKIPASGGSMTRISTAGVSNPSEPDWSPDGKWIAFTAQMGGFEICVVPANGGSATLLVSGEDPSWGANSRTLIFVKRGGRSRYLSLLDVPTKQVKDAARISGSSSQPSWAR